MSGPSEFESAIFYLKRVDDSGRSYYTHLIDIIVQIQNKQIPIEELTNYIQSISLSIKNSQLNHKISNEISLKKIPSLAIQKYMNSIEFTQNLLLRSQNILLSEKLSEYHISSKLHPRGPIVPNLLSQTNWLNENGITGLNEEESLKLQLRMDGLIRAEGLDNIKYWGKIYGIQYGDYWIIESIIDRRRIPSNWNELNKQLYESESNRINQLNNNNKLNKKKSYKKLYNQMEPIGTGVNEYVYYVLSSSLNSPWMKLPLLTPDMIQGSRSIHRLFTGSLSNTMKFPPEFPYSEAHYLRCQICRISHSTHSAPKGYMKISEAEEEIPENWNSDHGDEFEPKQWEFIESENNIESMTSDELLSLDNWNHIKCKLLKSGRITPFQKPEESIEEENDEELLEDDNNNNNNNDNIELEVEEEEEEESSGLLLGLDNDELLNIKYKLNKKLNSIWKLNLIGNINTNKLNSKLNSILLLSQLWPGSMNIVRDSSILSSNNSSTYCSIYYGYGQKFLSTQYTPKLPPQVRNEYKSHYEPEEEEVDPNKEQMDPLPPIELPEERNEDGDENGDDEDGSQIDDEDGDELDDNEELDDEEED